MSRRVATILLYGLPRFLVFIFSFVIVLVFVRFPHRSYRNFYFFIYIVFVLQIVIILVFRTHRMKCNNRVFVFVTKKTLGRGSKGLGSCSKPINLAYSVIQSSFRLDRVRSGKGRSMSPV